MKKYKIEHTPKDEQETFINIDKFEKKATITTHNQRVFNMLSKKLGTPHQMFDAVLPPKDNKYNYISGASWSYTFNNRKDIKQILSITNLIP